MSRKYLRLLAIIGGAATILLVIGIVVVALQPSEFRVARSVTIAAPREAVFAYVNDFHHWEEWSPWAELDPEAKATFKGPASGEGAVFLWDGNDDVGQGSMEIVESNPPESIDMRIRFVKPFEDEAEIDFQFEPQGEATLVTWSMSGKNNFIAKAICLFMDMDQMVGEKYEEGLANLKRTVESAPLDSTAADSPSQALPANESEPPAEAQ